MPDQNIFPTLRGEDECYAALQAIRRYFDSEPDEGSDEAAHFDALVLVIEDYEARHYPMPASGVAA